MPAQFSFDHGLCPCSSQCSRKKTRGCAILLGVSREPRSRLIRGWVADLFFCQNQGGREGRVYHFGESFKSGSCAKSENFSFGLTSEINAFTHNHNTSSRAWGK